MASEKGIFKLILLLKIFYSNFENSEIMLVGKDKGMWSFMLRKLEDLLEKSTCLTWLPSSRS